MGAIETIALSMGAGWAAGLNLYAAVFMLGLLSNTGNLTLPAELAVVADPLVMGAAGIMYLVEFFADKIPGLDTGWDAVHTFVRIPAGAVLAAGAVGDVGEPAQLAAGLLGGTLAAGSHFTKASTRAALNLSPEPVTNWTASITEDVAVVGGLWAALHYPLAFLAALVLFVALVVWITPKLVRGIKRFLARRRERKHGPAPEAPAAAEGTPEAPA